jgi:lipoprotein-releasing system permease protein
VVSANADIDATFAMIDIEVAERLLNYKGKWSGVAVKVENREQTERVKRALQEVVGKHLEVRTREQKSADMNSLIRLEKFAIILIGTFIAIIAAFAIVGAVVMLITDKRRDISTLRSMGASRGLIHKIFVGEGALLTLVGAAIGTIIGVGFSLCQEHFGWIKIPGNMVFESYPVELTAVDTVIVLGIVIVAGVGISHLTVRARLGKEDKI